MSKKYKAFIFDCDGTVLNTNPAIFNAWRLTVATFNKEVTLSDGDISKYFGYSVPEACAGLIKEYGKPEQNLNLDEVVNTYWSNHTSHPELMEEYPGLKDAMKQLKARGAKIMMVTSGRHDIVTHELKIFGMIDLFDAIVGEDDSPKLKPNPDPAYLACKLAGVKPEDTLFVGDAPSDFSSGNRAGMDTCCVPWSVCEKEKFVGDGIAKMNISKASELVDMCI